MKLELREPQGLSEVEVEELFTLFGTAFRASRKGFEEELREKEKVLLLKDEKGLQAFSTLRSFRPEAGVRVVFSGDTFVSPQARAGHRLPTFWAEYLFRQMPREEGLEDFWLLLCSGYRTYRILPTFFQNFVPGCQDQELLAQRDLWGERIFGERFQQGVVKPLWATPLHQPEPPPRLREDPYVRHFFQANPGYREGDELVCLIPLARSNLSPAGRRLVLGREAPARTSS